LMWTVPTSAHLINSKPMKNPKPTKLGIIKKPGVTRRNSKPQWRPPGWAFMKQVFKPCLRYLLSPTWSQFTTIHLQHTHNIVFLWINTQTETIDKPYNVIKLRPLLTQRQLPKCQLQIKNE